MKRIQICMHCGNPIDSRLACRNTLTKISSERYPYQLLTKSPVTISCPICKRKIFNTALYPYTIISRISTLMFYIMIPVSYLVLLNVVRLSFKESSVIIVCSIIVLSLIQYYSAYFAECILTSKRQCYIACDDADNALLKMPSHKSEYHLCEKKYMKELIIGNILQFRSENYQTYIFLKRTDTSGKCEFHPIPYTKDEQKTILPEHGELWNGEDVVATLSNIQNIERN